VTKPNDDKNTSTKFLILGSLSRFWKMYFDDFSWSIFIMWLW